jgi:hypothetical protein
VNRLADESALGRYANIAKGPGFAQALARVVTELRSAKLRPDALSSVAPDLLPMVEAYEAILSEDGFSGKPIKYLKGIETERGFKIKSAKSILQEPQRSAA